MEESIYKVPDGKMIKIRLQTDDRKIKSIVIMGDFFLYPEDTLDGLETSLIGAETIESILTEKIESHLSSKDAVLIGATSADLAKAIMMATKPT